MGTHHSSVENPETSTNVTWKNKVLLVMPLLFSCLCFVPMFTAKVAKDHDHGDVADDVNVPVLQQAAMAALTIVILPCIDVLIDFLNLEDQDTYSLRLTLAEKAVFILGVACLSPIGYNVLYNETPGHVVMVYTAFESASIMLMVSAVLSFLCRCSRSTTGAVGGAVYVSVGLLVCLGGFLTSLATVASVAPSSHPTLFANLTGIRLAARVCAAMAGCVFTLAAGRALLQNLLWLCSADKSRGMVGAEQDSLKVG